MNEDTYLLMLLNEHDKEQEEIERLEEEDFGIKIY